ncbi:hypothetical protein EGW08_010048 [Elysia chlorotica]|uniref:Uncharacterized protein n=1 Tax=Elysia chlorotica TaxID=188477 RepID=A0A3S0ZM17_ELYCH|nr:hypothetical protein EGW08_010048 [Elysia chlorotica]
MDTSQPLPNDQYDTEGNTLCYPPSQDGHQNGHNVEPNINGAADQGFIPQTPEKMVDEEIIDNDSDDAAGFVNYKANDTQAPENVCGDQEEEKVDRDWGDQGDIPHQDAGTNVAEGESDNHCEYYPHPQQPEAEGYAAATPAVEAAEIVVTSPEGVQSAHYMEATRNPEPDVLVVDSEPTVAAAAPVSQGEETPPVVMTPAKDQRPSATSTPRSLKDKISASE